MSPQHRSGTPPHVAVTGARGFIGRHLVDALARHGWKCRALTRTANRPATFHDQIEIVDGGLGDTDSLVRLLDGADALVHLAYPRGCSDEESVRLARVLAEVAARSNVRRVVHVSTAVVVGPPPGDVITEETPPRPRSTYERQKLRIEQTMEAVLSERVPLTVLRPTAVFGPGGVNLVKIADDFTKSGFAVRAVRRALLRSRRLNLVCVDNVVAAIVHALRAESAAMGGRYIVSDDDAPENNYGDVTAFLGSRAAVTVPRVPDLTSVARPLFRITGRGNPRAIFSPAKLMSTGFVPAISFVAGLERFTEWYLRREDALTV